MASSQLWNLKSPLATPPLPRRRPLRLRSSPFASLTHGSNPSGTADSFIGMWKRAKDRQEVDLLRLSINEETEKEERPDIDKRVLEEQTQRFSTLLQVPSEERDRVQIMQVVDRASAALAAAHALLAEESSFRNSAAILPPAYVEAISKYGGKTTSEAQSEATPTAHLTLGPRATPGPDFWTWSPPPSTDTSLMNGLQRLRADATPSNNGPAILEKDDPASLAIPFESKGSSELSLIFQRRARPSLPPLQSLFEVQEEVVKLEEEVQLEEEVKLVEEATTVASSVSFPDIGQDIASFFQQESLQDANINHGVNPDGSRWWKETAKELYKDGVTCTWTAIRGINANGTEWEEKFWEAYDDFDYRELGAEKSGRDAFGNVWREFWKEAMWQDLSTGLLHMEKTADKWGRKGQANEWHEKWWEHYNASGGAEKWADKWCKIDESTILEPGHAHAWHERWGEKFDGQGAAIKYTDKWAERAEFGGRSKWGDKWDENFDQQGHGVKQGETWWEGASHERWNRTWGEEHNGTGWVHKYGKSSSGEHWDTHEQQDTWYERQPHFGFRHCVENSRHLQRVGRNRNL